MVSPESARRDYAVAVTPNGALDEDATAALRGAGAAAGAE